MALIKILLPSNTVDIISCGKVYKVGERVLPT